MPKVLCEENKPANMTATPMSTVCIRMYVPCAFLESIFEVSTHSGISFFVIALQHRLRSAIAQNRLTYKCKQIEQGLMYDFFDMCIYQTLRH